MPSRSRTACTSARFNNGTWSVTARGFAAVAANKMLVMIDGRTVYSPLFTGVFWNALDYELEAIDRIEVIRGPGATLWGANAVNGVVNIVTKNTVTPRGCSCRRAPRTVASVRREHLSTS